MGIRKKTITYGSRILVELIKLICAALIFVCALGWNEAIKIYYEKQGWYKQHGLFYYALSISVFSVIFIIAMNYISSILKDKILKTDIDNQKADVYNELDKMKDVENRDDLEQSIEDLKKEVISIAPRDDDK